MIDKLQAHYGFTRMPFGRDLAPGMLHRHAAHNEACARITWCIAERAIGVIYRPETERMSHYFQARLADQFDAVLHFDETRAVEPLESTAEWEAGELPETFPFAV